MLLEGLQLPLTTPFYPDGRLNLRKLQHNVAAYSKTPVAGIAVLSEYGEPTALSDEETRQVLRAAIEAAAAEKVMLAGASRDSVLGTLSIADHAAGLGYDAVLVGQPSSLKAGNRPHASRELLTYFRSVADRSSIPLVLSSTDAAHGGSLPAEVVIELAGHPRIIGLVDGDAATDRIAMLQQATSAVKRDVTVTSVFAAVTGRMLSPSSTRSNRCHALSGYSNGRWFCGGSRSSCPRFEDANQTGWLSDLGREHNADAGQPADRSRRCDAPICSLRATGLLRSVCCMEGRRSGASRRKAGSIARSRKQT